MQLTDEKRGVLVGAFIVKDGDEILSITTNGQVVRSPIDGDFPAKGRSTMGVKFVSPKNGDSVAVVARSVEAREEEIEEQLASAEAAGTPVEGSADAASVDPDATIEATDPRTDTEDQGHD
jgi:DNA gyrase subunit A